MINRHASDLRVQRISPYECTVRTSTGIFRAFERAPGQWRAIDRYGIDVDAEYYPSGDDAVDAILKAAT